MKIAAFFLSLLSYCLLLGFFYFLFLQKPKKQHIVYVHTALITKNLIIKNNLIKRKQNHFIKPKTTVKKKIKKSLKIGSKSAFTKGGNVNFNDIFKNVNYNIPTKKINLSKQTNLSRFKGKILKQLENVKNINVNIFYNTHSNVSKGKINELINKIYEIWNNLSFIPGEYAIIKFINSNGYIQAFIMDSNLPMDKQKELISEIKKIKFNKNIEITIKFQTKVNK